MTGVLIRGHWDTEKRERHTQDICTQLTLWGHSKKSGWLQARKRPQKPNLESELPASRTIGKTKSVTVPLALIFFVTALRN